MCGIFGLFHHDGLSEENRISLLQEMAQTITHRGPDDHGVYHDAHVGLGNQRLSIIDVAHGHQPFISDETGVVLVQNGEIYNYVELQEELQSLGYRFTTHSDTEVLLYAYEAWGDTFTSKLNGMFAVALYDPREQSLKLFRDRLGIKPLYYYHRDGVFYFGSEIKTILAAGVERKLNHETLHHFLSFNYAPTPLTFFENIVELKPGHALTVTRDQLHTECWWSLTHQETQPDMSEKDALERLHGLLDDAVRLRLRSDVEVGTFLSGGVDSGTVTKLASMQQHGIRSFSIGFDDPKYDESTYAAESAAAFGTTHISKTVSHDMLHLWPLAIYYCDQPHGDVSFMPTYEVASLASEHLKVVLTGDGSDELFGGYDKYAWLDAHVGQENWQRDYFNAISLLSENVKHTLYGDAMKAGSYSSSFDRVRPLFDQLNKWEPLNQVLALDAAYLLPGNNLTKPDRMGMARSIEARTPFLDYRIAEFAFTVPAYLKRHNGENKYIVRQLGTQLMGYALANRTKQMFTVPIGEWFKNTLSGFVSHILLSNRASSRGLFDQDMVKRMIDEHVSEQANHTRILRALIAVELWHRIFIDRSELSCPTMETLNVDRNLLNVTMCSIANTKSAFVGNT